MKEIFKNIIKLNRVVPPDFVLRKFEELFHKDIQPEWYIYDNRFEAVFHENDKEKIAVLDREANLIDVKENLSLNEIPVNISKEIGRLGELMNLIMIKKQSGIYYELIIRDIEMNRYLLLTDDAGNILEKKKL